jgi:hypothetical protein
MQLNQSTQLVIKELTLSTEFGVFDVSYAFNALIIYDTIYSPCMTGSIVLIDAISLLEKLRFDGNEYINVKISKTVEDKVLELQKRFRVYKVADIVNINQSSKTYVLHFTTPDFLLSEQTKVAQVFTGTYSSMVDKILKNYLRVSATPANGASGLGAIEPSKGSYNYIAPTLTPFQTINEIAKRAVSNKNKPDYLFFENLNGYNFISLSTLFASPTVFKLNFGVKNVEDNIGSEFFGVRNMKILTQNNMVDNIRNGSIAGRFIGFDTLTRKLKMTNLTPETIHDGSVDVRLQTNVGDLKDVNKFGSTSNQMVNSRVMFYPFTAPRQLSNYIKESDPSTANAQDNTQEYKFHRKAILSLLGQKKMELALPGNFKIMAGSMVQLDVPKYSVKTESVDGELDPILSGRYIVTATRHSITPTSHETFLEVSSIYTKKKR